MAMTPWVDRLPPSLRGLMRHKRFSALAIVSLGVAIALNTTMYSVTDAILFPRIAMHEPENLYRLAFYGDYRGRLTPEQKLEAIRGFTFFEDLAARSRNYSATNLAENGSLSRTARVLVVSHNYFALLGVTPMSGRLFTEGDANAPVHPVVVSERFWRQMFPVNAMTDTVSFMLDGQPRVVIGVLAYESDFPGENTDIWQLPSGNTSGSALTVLVANVVRLRKGLALERAYAEMEAAAARLSAMAGDGPRDARYDLVRYVDGPMRFENFHVAVVGAVLFVLLVASFNLGNLQLVRGLGRTREFATRAAVGATRRDLVALLLSESAWIAGAGLLLGVILTFWGVQFVKSQIPPTLEQYLVRPQVSWRLFAFATATSGLALAIVGLIPAIRVSRIDVNELLKSTAGTGAMRRSRWQSGSFVVLQVGLALALMAGAALLVRASASLYQLEINPILDKIVTARVNVRPGGAGDRRLLRDAGTQLMSRAQGVPGVVAVASSRSAAPEHKVISLSQESMLPREIATGQWQFQYVSDTYLTVYGMKVLKGRNFSPGETGRAVILDEQTARFFWPGADPIGRQIKFGSAGRRDEGWFEVVGVAQYVNTWSSFRRANQADRLEPRLGAVWVLNAADTLRLSSGERPWASGLTVHVRGTDKLERLPLMVRGGLSDPGAGFGVVYVERLMSALQLDVARKVQDFVAGLFTSFAMLALALSTLGVYAVVSHTVSLRTREIGVRVALGADEQHIRQSVLVQGNTLALLGIAVGLLIASNTTRYLSRFTLGSGPEDVWMFCIAVVVLFVATLVASWVPARRAMRINPVEALRHE